MKGAHGRIWLIGLWCLLALAASACGNSPSSEAPARTDEPHSDADRQMDPTRDEFDAVEFDFDAAEPDGSADVFEFEEPAAGGDAAGDPPDSDGA